MTNISRNTVDEKISIEHQMLRRNKKREKTLNKKNDKR